MFQDELRMIFVKIIRKHGTEYLMFQSLGTERELVLADFSLRE